MAQAGVEPVAANPLLARRTLDEHLRRRGDGDPEIVLVDDLVAHVWMYGQLPDETVDPFLLRLDFRCYDDWPPGAQFINPETGTFVIGEDNRHLPRIEGSQELNVHASYGTPAIQLICSSVTLEFYEVRHSVEERHVWQRGTHTLWSTVHAIDRHLRQPWFKGRWA